MPELINIIPSQQTKYAHAHTFSGIKGVILSPLSPDAAANDSASDPGPNQLDTHQNVHKIINKENHRTQFGYPITPII